MKSKRMVFVLFACVFALFGFTHLESMQCRLLTQKECMNDHILTKKTKAISDVRNIAETLTKKINVQETAKKLLQKVKTQKEKQHQERTIQANITTYGLECVGCKSINGRGGTAGGVSLDARLGVLQPNGNWQSGITYGNYYIIAADQSIPMCSIFKISNHGLSGAGIDVNQPFYAMVMDRGGGIHGNHFDLYIGLQSNNPLQRVYASKASAELIRYGGANGQGCAL